jgi:hypothetical protein
MTTAKRRQVDAMTQVSAAESGTQLFTQKRRGSGGVFLSQGQQAVLERIITRLTRLTNLKPVSVKISIE